VSNGYLYNDDDVAAYYEEFAQDFDYAEKVWDGYVSWCLEHKLDPESPETFSKYLERET